MIDTSLVVADEDMHLFTINREIHIYISKDSHLNFEIQMSINTSRYVILPPHLYKSTTKSDIKTRPQQTTLNITSP
jgi:hypothetical protein